MRTIRQLFEHVEWANVRMLEAIRQADDVSEYVTTIFHHILRAEQIWLTRLQGGDSSHIPLWTDCDLERLTELLQANQQSYEDYLATLDDAQLDRKITYGNQSGKASYETSIRDILTHVALHGQYHRGQINAALRREQQEPINVDFITYIRNR